MTDSNLLDLTTSVVTAYLSRNQVAAGEVGSLIASIHRALAQADAGEGGQSEPEVARATAAQIRKSQSGDKLISFEDGRPYSSLKRHLTGLGLTPDDYRAKWGLPANYPMVAPAYSARRSALAKSLGLGQKGRGKKAAKAPAKRSKR